MAKDYAVVDNYSGFVNVDVSKFRKKVVDKYTK